MAPRSRSLDSKQLVELADRCNLEVTSSDLEQMVRRGLLEPVESPDREEQFGPLHLYVIARYLEAVRPIRHPWGTETPETTLDDVSALARDVKRLLEAADGAESSPDAAFIAGRLDDMDAFLERIDPFGPLGEVFDLIRPSVIEKLESAGRLYAEIRRARSDLEEKLRARQTRQPGRRGRRTRQMHDLEADDETGGPEGPAPDGGETDGEPGDAIDEVVSAADEVPESRDEEESEPPTTREVEAPPEADGGRPMKAIQVKLEPDQKEPEVGDEESSDPIVLVEDESGDVHVEEPREHSESESSSAAKTARKKPAQPPPSPAERREEFEKKKSRLTEREEWDDLVELYRETIESFDDTRQRLELTFELARIFEVKVRDRDRAFEAFERAWSLAAETEEGRERAFEGIRRLGKSPGFHERYLEWLRDRLAGTLEADERAQIHKELARGLFADQQYDEAFESFASYLLEAPTGELNRDMLEQLDRLADPVDRDRIEAFFAELRDRDLGDETGELIEEFEPSSA